MTPRALLRLAAVALLAALGGCEKSGGDALLVLRVTSDDAPLTVVRTFVVNVTTRPEAGQAKTARLSFELPDGGTLSVSSTPVVLEVRVSAEHGTVDVEISALDATMMKLASGSSKMIQLNRGAQIPVGIALRREQTLTDGGTDGAHDVAGNPQRARWPMPNNPIDVDAGAPHPATFVDEGDGTVTDEVTHLAWQKGVSSRLPGDAGAAEVLTQLQAADYCQSLVLGGYEDWRVPTLIELVSIVDDSKSAPSAYPGFTETPPADFWSATPDVDAPANAWAVDFSKGELVSHKKADRLHVRCVRSDARGPATAYTISDGGTVTDDETQLNWQRSSAMAKRTEADAQCQTMGEKWRLPTKNELLTLVDYSRKSPAIDPLAFPATPNVLAFYWSSTGTSTVGWGVDFTLGQPFLRDVGTPNLFRCVSSR